MNKKAELLLKRFRKSISYYMKQEYHPKYYKYYRDNKTKFIPIIASLYWGGENVPNTTFYIIEDIKRVK